MSPLVRHLLHGEMTGAPLHAVNPTIDGWVDRQVEAALMGNMGVGIQADVGNTAGIPGHIGGTCQLLLHQFKAPGLNVKEIDGVQVAIPLRVASNKSKSVAKLDTSWGAQSVWEWRT